MDDIAERVEAMKQAEAETAVRVAAEMRQQMWELAGKPEAGLAGPPDADYIEIKAARKQIILRLGQVACGVESMSPEELEAARIMLNAGF